MFKLFSSKKKKEAVRLEKQDSFYQAGGDDDLGSEEEDTNNMNDEEYRRRVTEEIAKRKSVASGKKVASPTSGAAPSPTASLKPISTSSIHGKSAGPSPSNGSRSNSTTPTSSVATPVVNRPAPGVSAAPSPVAVASMRPNPATSAATTPTAAGTNQRTAPTGHGQAAVAGPAKTVTPMAANSARPATATTPTGTAKPTSAPLSAPTTPASPPAAAGSAPAAVPFVPDPKAVQQLVSMGFSVPTVHYALRVRKNRADHAAEFLLEHTEAAINRMIANAAKRGVDAPPGAGGVPVATASMSAAVPAPTTSAATTVVTPTPINSATSASTSTSAPPRSLSPIAPPLRSTAADPSSYSSSSSDNSPRAAAPEGDPSVQAAMASIIAKREALKKKQAAEQLRREASTRKVPAASPSKANNEASAPVPASVPALAPAPAASGSAPPKAIYDRLSEYKTKGQAAFEDQEAEDRERRESQERRRKALAAGSNPTSPSGNDDTVLPSPSAAPLRRTNSSSGLAPGTAFENLFLKKTKSMIIKEKMDEEDKAFQEKKAKRLSGGEGESEVFDKLYTKKLKAHQLAEKAEQEEKARLAKVEAQTAGKVGAALPARDSSPLLKKTKSAFFRELDIADSKARFEVLQMLEKEKQPTPRRRSNSFSSANGSVTARSADGSVSLAKRLSGGLSRNGSGATTGNAEGGDATPDTEDDAGEAGDGAGAGKQSGTVSSLSSPRLDGKALSIQGLVPRTPMNYKVVETPDHRWEGRVCAPWRDVGNMILLRGTYPDRAQCIAITAASAPPTYVVQTKSCICKVCEEPFNKYLKAENCRNCGQLVCPDCSTESWPQSMLPETYNETKSPFLRVCRACDQAMERFANALTAGDLDVVQAHYKAGNVNLHHPYTTLPESPYPIHCAAASGNVKVLQWLVEQQHCLVRDANTGEHLTNAAGHTVLAVAALRGDKATMHYCVMTLRCSLADITDVTALQRGLHAALEAPGPLPSLTLRRAAAAPTASVRRYEKLQTSNGEPSPAPSPSAPSIRTDTLLSKAAELNSRLIRSSSTSTMTSPVKPPLAPAGSTPVTPLGGATAAAGSAAGVATVAAGADVTTASATGTNPAPESAVQNVVEESAQSETAPTIAPTTSTGSEPATAIVAATGDSVTAQDASGSSPVVDSPAEANGAVSTTTAEAPVLASNAPIPVEEPRSTESAPAPSTEDEKEPVKIGAEATVVPSEPVVEPVPLEDAAAPAAVDTVADTKGEETTGVMEGDQPDAAEEPAVPPMSAAPAESSAVVAVESLSEVPLEASTEGDKPDAAPQSPAADCAAADAEQAKLAEEPATDATVTVEVTPTESGETAEPLVIETGDTGADAPATDSEAQLSPPQASPSQDSVVAPSPPKSGSPRQASSRARPSPSGPPAGLRRLNSMKTEPPLTKAPSVRLGMPGGASLPRTQSARMDSGAALTSPPK